MKAKVEQPVVRKGCGFPGERMTILPPSVLRRGRALPGCRGLCVTHTGRFDHARGHYIARRRGAREYVLILCLDGAGEGHLDETRWSLRAGQGVLLPPGRSHDYAADAKSPWTIIWFHFVGVWAGEYARLIGGAGRTRKFTVHNIEVVVDAFEECHRYVSGGYTDADLIGLSTSFSRFMGLCRTLQQPADPRCRRSREQVLRTIRYMRENLGRSISLEELARAAGLSIPHYSAMFKRQMNCSPIGFLTRLRLQKACERIEHSDDTIAEIGYAVGYGDPLYFSRVFRRHMGATASEYRSRIGG